MSTSERSRTSDEPTRLDRIVRPLFADQHEGRKFTLANGEYADLVAGSDAQDDCAVFHLSGEQDLVFGSDYVRGAKFMLYERGYLDNYDVGYYLAMANFSDIAAMGAQPIALLSVVRYPRDMPDDEFRNVMCGIKDACARAGALNVGGDIGTAERLILSASAAGVVETGRGLLRSTARPGDRLCVTGATGLAAAAQKYFMSRSLESRRLRGEDEDILLSAWKRPDALITQGRLLSTSEVVTSCQDTSDGLKATIQSIAALSRVGFVVDAANLPVSGAVRNTAALHDLDLLSLILGDSVDFQLMFTVSPDHIAALRDAFSERGLSFADIGTAVDGRDVLLRTPDGDLRTLPGNAWRHQT